MGDRTSAYITISGNIASPDVFDGLVNAACDEGVGLDWGTSADEDDLQKAILEAIEEGTSVTFFDSECNYGTFDTLEDFCRGADLAYFRYNDAGGDYSAAVTSWQPGMIEPTGAPASGEAEALVEVSALVPLLALPPDRIVAELEKAISPARAANGDGLPAKLTAPAEIMAALQEEA